MVNPEGYERPPSPLHAFQAEVRAWQTAELEKKARGEHYDPHAENIDPDILTAEEMELAERTKNGMITRDDLEGHRRKVEKRGEFFAKIVNDALPAIVQREREQRRNR